MKVVILCGGRGLRMSPLTEEKPKPMLEIGDLPILHHIMNHFSFFQFKEFVLCTGYKGEVIEEYFKDSRIIPSDWKVDIINTGVNNLSASRILQVREYIKDENFFIVYGDCLSDLNLHDLLHFHLEKGLLTTITGVHPRSPYGIIHDECGVVTKFEEKPVMKEVVNGGYFVMSPSALHYLDHQYYLEQKPLAEMVENNQLAVFDYKGFWANIETIKDIESLNKMRDAGIVPWEFFREVNL